MAAKGMQKKSFIVVDEEVTTPTELGTVSALALPVE